MFKENFVIKGELVCETGLHIVDLTIILTLEELIMLLFVM